MRGMKKFGRLMMAVLAVGALGRTARAVDEQPKTLDQRVHELEKKVDQSNPLATLGITVHGLVAVDYLYDINRPDVPAASSPTGGSVTSPNLRSFENEKNSFILNQGNLHFERQPDNLPGFVTDLNFGKTADVVNNATHFSGSATSLGNGTDFFDASQFYLSYTVPVGNGIKLKAGRFVTLMGAEVIKTYNSLNYNVTNSILFGFAIPFTHTGVMGTYAFSDLVSLDLGVVNGWDAVADNNDGKSLMSGLTLTFDPKFVVYQTVMYGPEQAARTVTDNLGDTLTVHPGRSKRLMLTTLVTAKPTDALTLIGDFDYGNDSDSVPVDGLLRTAQWLGFAGYIVYAFNDSLSATLRAEVFDDMNGARVLGPEVGLPTGGKGVGATYYEFTPTLTYKLADGLLWRNEYRHDESDTKKAFAREANFVRGQDTLATELVYTF